MRTVRDLLKLENQADFLRERRSWPGRISSSARTNMSSNPYNHIQKGLQAPLMKPSRRQIFAITDACTSVM
jgi:hypothetical protein